MTDQLPGWGRLRLTTLQSAAGLPSTGLVDAVGYSRFKHGDAIVGRRYAMALAALAARSLGAGPVRVTTSAYDQVPPAAHSLLAPFVQHLCSLRPRLSVTAFRVVRRGVSNGDYSRMDLSARRTAFDAGDLTTAETDLAGAVVLALDDIRVTGTHERVMDDCLSAAGVSQVRHLYVVDAYRFAGLPSVESVLNEAAIGGVADLLEIASSARFSPNSRFCRRVLALPDEDLALLLRDATPQLRGWLQRAVELDRLAQVPAYAARVRVWSALLSQANQRSDIGVDAS